MSRTKAILKGITAFILSLFFTIPLILYFNDQYMVIKIIALASIEEIFKYTCTKIPKKNNAFFTGIGFGLVELSLMVLQIGVLVIPKRIIATIFHGIWTSISANYKYGIVISILLHSTFNYCLITLSELPAIKLLLFISIIITSILLVINNNDQYQQKKVLIGVTTLCCSPIIIGFALL